MYTAKVEFIGNEVVIKRYEMAQRSGSLTSERAPERQKVSEEEAKENQRKAVYRARRTLYRITSSNFGFLPRIASSESPGLKFLTLTYRDNMQDRRELASDWKQFVQRVNRAYERPLTYVAVPERQKRGAWHIHAILHCEYRKHSDLLRLWQNTNGKGSVNIKAIDSLSSVGGYIAKYIGKDFGEEGAQKPPLFKGEKQRTKRFFKSRNLKDLSLDCFMDYKEENHLKDEDLKVLWNNAKVDKSNYKGEYTGQVDVTHIVFPPNDDSKALISTFQNSLYPSHQQQ